MLFWFNKNCWRSTLSCSSLSKAQLPSLKLTANARENRPKRPKRKRSSSNFQPSIFRCDSLVSEHSVSAWRIIPVSKWSGIPIFRGFCLLVSGEAWIFPMYGAPSSCTRAGEPGTWSQGKTPKTAGWTQAMTHDPWIFEVFMFLFPVFRWPKPLISYGFGVSWYIFPMHVFFFQWKSVRKWPPQLSLHQQNDPSKNGSICFHFCSKACKTG